MKRSAVHRRDTAACAAVTAFLWTVGAVVDITEDISSVRTK
jgi:hypothetical protein